MADHCAASPAIPPTPEELAVIDQAFHLKTRNLRLVRGHQQMLEAVLRCSSVPAARRLVREEVSSMIHDYGTLSEDRARKLVRDNIRYLLRQPSLAPEKAAELTVLFAAEEGREVPCDRMD